jgi:hypothetical protein
MRRPIIISTLAIVMLAAAILTATLRPGDTPPPHHEDDLALAPPAGVVASDHEVTEAPREVTTTNGPQQREQRPEGSSPSGGGAGSVGGAASGGGATSGGGALSGGGGTLPELPEPGEEFHDEDDEPVGELEPVDPDFSPEGIGFKSPWSGEVTDGVLGPQDMKDGRGCSVMCITRGVAIGRGTGAEVVVETDTPARLWIVVWKQGSYHSMRYAGDELRTGFTSLFDDLEPGTTYLAAAFAQDAEGFQSEAYGSLTTRRRHVRVEFGATNITGTPWGADRYSVYPRVDHQWLPQFAATGLTEPHHNPMGGLQVVELSDVGTHLDVATKVVASKKPAKKDVCEGWHLPSDTILENTTNCLAWGVAPDGITLGLELDGSPSGDGPPQPRTFWRLLSGDNGEGLHFMTSVTVTVWYE